MGKIISAPENEIYAGQEISLSSIDLENENPELFEYFQMNEQAIKEDKLTGGSWYRSGSGPAPKEGGVWIGGNILTPFNPQVVPVNATIKRIEYSWDNTHLRRWDHQVTVRLVVFSNGRAGAADITRYNNGIITSDGSLFARAQLQFQMAVGSLRVGLHNPPYISIAGAAVYY